MNENNQRNDIKEIEYINQVKLGITKENVEGEIVEFKKYRKQGNIQRMTITSERIKLLKDNGMTIRTVESSSESARIPEQIRTLLDTNKRLEESGEKYDTIATLSETETEKHEYNTEHYIKSMNLNGNKPGVYAHNGQTIINGRADKQI